MTSKVIEITGKEIGLAYCYATEIGFKKMTGVNIEEFDPKNSEHAAYLIIAAIMAYYQAKGEESPIKSEALMYECKPNEIIEAMKAVFELRMEWYELPFEDDDDKKEEGDEKNA